MEETLRRQGIEYRVVDSRRGELKTCYFCKVETPVECFSVKMRFRKDVNPPTVYFGYSSYCINCQPKKMKDYYEREKSSGKWNLYSRANGLKKYGLTEDDYNDLLEAQGGGCAICGVEDGGLHKQTGKQKKLAVDHDEETGVVRGLLCQKHNMGLGQFDHDPELLVAAAAYLIRVEEVE